LNLQSLNRYSYVLNSPMNLVDPSGFQGGPSDGNRSTASPQFTLVYIPAGTYEGQNTAMYVLTPVNNQGQQQATAPKDIAPADTSQSGQGSSQTTPQPVSAEKPIQPEAPVSPPTPSLGGSGPSSITMPNPQPDAGGARPAPSGAEPGMATGSSVQQMMLTMGTPAGAGSLNLTPDMPAGDPAAQASVVPGIGEAMDLYVLPPRDADASPN